MRAWRMAFRVGNQGPSLWSQCLRFGVAAITYEPLLETDLSRYPKGEPKARWNQLEPTQKASLRRLAYEMKPGDVIYVKDGPRIVDRGVVTGGYFFDHDFRVKMPDGRGPWAHQVQVDWSRNFPTEGIPILLGAEQLTVKELALNEVERLEQAINGSRQSRRRKSSARQTRRDSLIEDAYYRETQAVLKIIVPLHNKLSNSFVHWLKAEHGVTAAQEQDRIDIQFDLKGKSNLAELKVCFGVETRNSIREALGQLFEYNHYPNRRCADVWLIVLDKAPSENDLTFIQNLKDERDLPLVIGWQVLGGFMFQGAWPC
jgi:hypothetical protein